MSAPRRPSLWFIALVALAAAPPADAQDAPAFPTTAFADGATTASVTDGDVTATIAMVGAADAAVPVLTVTVRDIPVLETAGIGSGMGFPTADAAIAEMDPDNDNPEVVFASYSGGAHCCTTVIVAEAVGAAWVSVPVGDFDGGGNYLHDLDGDGLAEIATVDNRFLYQFDCYACSAAPLSIYTVRDGMVVDVSAADRYREAHIEWLATMESAVDPAERWHSPGYLAGWLASKVRLGDGAEAWEELNANWDFASDPGEAACTTGGMPEDCAQQDIAVLPFPERLKLFLTANGYEF